MGRSKDLATGETRFANVSGDTFTGLVNITNTYSSDTTEQLRVSDNTGSKLDFFGHANGTKSIQAYADDGSTFYNLNLQPLGGYVTTPNQPAFMVIMTSAPTLTGTSTTTLPFNSEIFDTGSNYNTSNYRFTAPVSGKYHMHLHVELGSNSSWTTSTWSYIGDYFVNGTRKTGADFWGHSGKYNLASNAAILELNANDYVDVRARPNNNSLQYSGDSAGAFSNCRWFGYLIG